MRSIDDDVMDLTVVAHAPVNVMVTANDADDRLALAHRIHHSGSHRTGRFVGVFTGRKRLVRADDIAEWFAQAAGGTLFIDNVGYLSLQAQDRLVQLLTHQLHRASLATMPDGRDRVRIIAGCDRSLCADLALGAFSDVLFYRLNVIHIDQTA
jgi:transcriptional regulator of acetoin/glycerol metabolism